jgi:hypothetical protein
MNEEIEPSAHISAPIDVQSLPVPDEETLSAIFSRESPFEPGFRNRIRRLYSEKCFAVSHTLCDQGAFEQRVEAVFRRLARENPEVLAELVFIESCERTKRRSPYRFDLKPIVQILRSTLETELFRAQTEPVVDSNAPASRIELFRLTYAELAERTWRQGLTNYFKHLKEPTDRLAHERHLQNQSAYDWYESAEPRVPVEKIKLSVFLFGPVLIAPFFYMHHGFSGVFAAWFLSSAVLWMLFQLGLRAHRLFWRISGVSEQIYTLRQANRFRFSPASIDCGIQATSAKIIEPSLANSAWPIPEQRDNSLVVSMPSGQTLLLPRFLIRASERHQPSPQVFELRWRNGSFFIPEERPHGN